MAAKDFRLSFGKFAGRTLSEVAGTDEGLKYLDWYRGARPDSVLGKIIQEFFDSDQTLERELSRLLDD